MSNEIEIGDKILPYTERTVRIELGPGKTLEINVEVDKLEGTWIPYDQEQQDKTGLKGLFWRLEKTEYLPDGHKSYYTYYRVRKDGQVSIEPMVFRYDNRTGLTTFELPPSPTKNSSKPSDLPVYVSLGDPKPEKNNPKIHILTLVRLSAYTISNQ
jgi:hypothetical protein